MRRSVAALGLALVLGACTNSISSNPLKDLVDAGQPPATTTAPIAGTPAPAPAANVIVTDIQSASFDLDQAVAVGALTADDPAPKCLHGVMTQLGIDPANPPAANASFTPKNDGLVSAGAILYIRAQQIKRAGGAITVPVDCKSLIGQLVIDAGSAQAKALPGGGLLPTLQ